MSDCIIPRQGDGCVEIFVRVDGIEHVFELDVQQVLYFLRILINDLDVR